MRLFNSIRWRLMFWFAVLLGFVLLGLDLAAYEIHFSNRIALLDTELRQRVAALSATVFAPRTPGQFNGEPADMPGPPARPQEEQLNAEPRNQGSGQTSSQRDRQPGGPGGPGESGPGGPEGPEGPGGNQNPPPDGFNGQPPFDEAQLAAALKQYQAGGKNGFFFAVWLPEPVSLFKQSSNHLAAVPRPVLTSQDTGTYARTRDGCREIFHATEHADCILVGRTLAPERADARRFAGLLALGSAVVLALGLGGTWLIITRALRPVEKISAAAMQISSGDLSRRINVAETESELDQLAVVLNSTFARLEAAFGRQKQFTADAAHELRTPVSVMLTHTQNGLASECACEEHREAFEACQRAARRMKKLISTLLALARLDDGRERARLLKFDLARTVRECVDLLQPLADEQHVRLTATLPPLEITGDAEQIAQVVTNLVVNALQYNRPGGQVCLQLARQGGAAVLAVSDTGVGIPAADLPRVFERFYRADQSRSAGGLGLGLAISRAIVEAHHGRIEVTSQENAGTTFTVTLPVAPAGKNII